MKAQYGTCPARPKGTALGAGLRTALHGATATICNPFTHTFFYVQSTSLKEWSLQLLQPTVLWVD